MEKQGACSWKHTCPAVLWLMFPASTCVQCAAVAQKAEIIMQTPAFQSSNSHALINDTCVIMNQHLINSPGVKVPADAFLLRDTLSHSHRTNYFMGDSAHRVFASLSEDKQASQPSRKNVIFQVATVFSGMFAQVFLFTVLSGKGNVSVHLSSVCHLLRVRDSRRKK